MTRSRAGRRPGNSGTREAIEAAARRQFAELGYDRTSLRQVALEAGVDPTLVSHFYGSKQRLFLQVVELPFTPSEVLPPLLQGDPGEVGRRLAGFVVGVLEDERARGRLVGMVRSAASEPEASRLVRELVTRELLLPLAQALGGDQPLLRASLVASQIVGLVMARAVVQLPALTATGPEQLAGLVAPVFQHYLTGELPGPPA